MSAGAPLIRAEGVAAGYGPVDALTELTVTVSAGERLGVLGPNGGGKTTFFRLLTGELTPRRGTLEVGRVAIVAQTERSRLDYPVSALDVALMGAVSRLPWWRRPQREDRERAREALTRVGLDEQAERTFGDLSGGQRQRVLVARALVQDAPVVLFDEPFTGLDATSADRLERLLADLAADGRAVLIATHDVSQARAWDQVLCLNRRQVAHGPPSVLTRTVLEQTYGEALTVLEDDPAGGQLTVLPIDHHHHPGA